MDDNLRVTICPKCNNEQFGEDAEFCRICGTSLFNMCEGENIYDYDGNFENCVRHKNQGNARFCEKCGQPTEFFKLKFLVPYEEFRTDYMERYLEENPNTFFDPSPHTFENDSDEEDFSF